jgi:hypothetical protein
MKLRILIGFLAFLLFVSCTSVEPQKNNYLFDPLYSEIIKDFKFDLSIKPTNRTIEYKNNNELKYFDAYGYRIYIPSEHKLDIYRITIATLAFSQDGFFVSFKRPKEESRADLIMDSLNKENFIIDHQNPFIEYTANENRFKLVKDILNLNESNFQIGISKSEYVKYLYLLFHKKAYLGACSGYKNQSVNVYSFQTEKLKGFQIGNPKIHKNVSIYVFPNNKVEIELMIGKFPDSLINQDFVDEIICGIEELNT